MRTTIRLAATAAIGVVALLSGAATSTAGVSPGSTAIDIQGTESDPDNGFAIVYGRVFAQPQQCAKNRRVLLQFDDGSGFETTDSGPTSSRAYFTLAGPITSGPDAGRVVAPKKRIKVGGKQVTCRRATAALAI